MMGKLFYLPLFLSLSFTACTQTPREKGLQVITRAAAEESVGLLASDRLEGREAGTRGGRMAGDYIASSLQAMGIQPFFEGSYEQPFAIYPTKRREWNLSYSFRPENENDTTGRLSLRNIVGKIEGRTPDEYVIVGAHYDHLGIDPSLAGDTVYNGADDNASGVSAVLQIACAFLATGVQPERTVLFACWDGEEKGLLGSRYFVSHLSDISRVKAYLNFDMVGRNTNPDKPSQVVCFFSQDHPVFAEWVKDDIRSFGLQLSPDYRAVDASVGGSDNVPFSRAGIPILWYHTDRHPDYHTPTDHADRLNWPKLVDITRAAFLNLWNLANEESF